MRTNPKFKSRVPKLKVKCRNNNSTFLAQISILNLKRHWENSVHQSGRLSDQILDRYNYFFVENTSTKVDRESIIL